MISKGQALTLTILLEHLREKKLLDSEGAFAVRDAVLKIQARNDPPFLVYVLTAIGAWHAAALFGLFFAFSGIIDFESPITTNVWGVIFILISFFLLRLSKRKAHAASGIFIMQVSFCSILLGKLLLALGGYQLMDSNGWLGSTMLVALATVLAYPFYTIALERFLSSWWILTSLPAALLGEKMFADQNSFTLKLVFIGLVVAVGMFVRWPKFRFSFSPVYYAFLFALLNLTITYSSITMLFSPSAEGAKLRVFLSILYALAFLLLIARLRCNLTDLFRPPLLPATLGVALLCWQSHPGILLAIAFLVLGYLQFDRLIIGIAFLFLPVFIFLFYYDLHLSLLAKSGMLIAGGMVLLAGRLYMTPTN